MFQNEFVHSDTEIMSGTPVFRGTRVPATTLFDYLKKGYPISEFLDDFPSVSIEQATGLLEFAQQSYRKAA